MAKIKRPKQGLFTLLTAKAYNLENEFNFEIDSQTLGKERSRRILLNE
jgi:hypothetical protein